MKAAVDSPPAPDMGPGGALDGVSGAEEGEETEEADGLVAVEEEVQQALLDEVREHGGPDSATDTSPAPVASRLTKDALLAMVANFAAGGTPGAASSQWVANRWALASQGGSTLERCSSGMCMIGYGTWRRPRACTGRSSMLRTKAFFGRNVILI